MTTDYQGMNRAMSELNREAAKGALILLSAFIAGVAIIALAAYVF